MLRMDISHIINDLNDPQREAVTAPLGNTLVLAGAGSGKTRVLVHRIIWLIEVEKISPYSIMAVTFTNKAAKEMRGRIESMLQSSIGGAWVGTFHGLAHRLLKLHWQEAGLPENFQILDSDDQLRLVKRLIKERNLDESYWQPKKVQWYINHHKDEGRRAGHIKTVGPDEKVLQSLYLTYETRCNNGGMVDFAELLLRSHELWLNNPELLALYQNRFSCLLVDEFQDTNSVQYAWLRVLSGGKIPVMAVGDDDQSVYSWRGAQVENIQCFTQDFPEVTTVRLEQNYRSTQTILNAANAVIDNNSNRLGKKLWSDGDEGERIKLFAGFNELDEARFIAEQAAHWNKQGYQRKDIAVLYRSNAQSRVIEESFLRDNIPYRIYGGQRFYDRVEIKNALAYLRLINNENDDPAFERIINTPTRGIGLKTVEILREIARGEGISLWQATQKVISEKLMNSRGVTALDKFLHTIEQMQEALKTLPLHEQIEHTLNHSGLLEFHGKEKGEKGEARVENLKELISASKAFVAPDKEMPELQQFLDGAALDAGDMQADEFEDSIQMMTLHSAKGLEFPIVFITGIEENIFPHSRSVEDSAQLQEERRLCYVGITRAKEKLYLTFAESRRLYGDEKHNPLSRFVKEIPKECIEEVRINNTVSYQRQARYPAVKNTINLDGIALGVRVSHAKFGDGIVLQIEGSGAHARVQVKFEIEGSKWLVLSYANLQVI